MHFYQKTVEQTYEKIKTSARGLTTAEAARRLVAYGPNSLRITTEPLWKKILEPFLSVFMVVLVIAAFLSFLSGEPLDGIIVTVIIAISVLIFYVQRFSTERVLKALKQHDVQMVQVLRADETIQIAAEQLVPGDIVILNEGEKVPADMRLIHTDNLRADEALLTGESAPVDKHVHALKGEKTVSEQTNMVFQGSFIVSGEAAGIVVATGNQTEFGRIAELASAAVEPSPAQQKIDALLSRLIIIILGIVLIVLALTLYRGMPFGEAFRFVISMAVSAVPEGLPIAISVILVLGMRRLAKHRALVRSMAAIENVGIVTSIATDKTGTLTKNILTVHAFWQIRKTREAIQQLYLSANHANGRAHDPLDSAFIAYAKQYKITHAAGRTLAKTLSFDQKEAMSGNIWQEGEVFEALIKGAPEVILRRSKLTEKERQQAEEELKVLTGQGLRVIGLARIAPLRKTVESVEDLPAKDFHFVGFVAVADILRADAKGAIAAAQSAGISVQIITGDHVETAFAIGKQLGLVKHRDQVLDCRAIGAISDDKLFEITQSTKVFARVLPEHKYRILDVLKRNNVTAMTGDGVNDVPALVKAHVGFAMGSGTQIAKESGDIVLLNNSFKTIVEAIRGGRVIFDNIRRMLFYLLATSLGEVLTMIGALIIGLPLPVVAVQVLWINLVTDSLLVIPLGLEPAEDDVMKRQPRAANQPILDRHILWRLGLVALTMAIVAISIFAYYLSTHDLKYAQSITFSTLVVMQWANAMNARSEWQSLFARLKYMNKKIYIGLTAAAILQALVFFGPLGAALHVGQTSIVDLLLTAAIGVTLVVAVVELHKFAGRRKMQ